MIRTTDYTMFPYWEQVKNRGEVIAYYEGEMHYPPAHLIEPLAKALKISTDEHQAHGGQIFIVNIFATKRS